MGEIISNILMFFGNIFKNNFLDGHNQKILFDKELYKKSNEIFNEDNLNEFIQQVCGLRYSGSLTDKVEDYLQYFKKTSNKYFDNEVFSEFDKFYKSLDMLYMEVLQKSMPHTTLYKNNIFRLFTDFQEDNKSEISLFFQKICKEVEVTFINYRTKIREKFIV